MGKIYNLWVLIEPAEDVAGEWIAHCLEVDVISQGTSPKHALDMVVEALTMTMEHDLREGRDPFDRRAPQEYWDQLYAVLKEAVPFRVSVNDMRDHYIVAQIQMHQVDHRTEFETPVAWRNVPHRDSHPC